MPNMHLESLSAEAAAAKAAAHAKEGAQPEYYIPATASQLDRRTRTLKEGDMFAIFNPYGDAGGTPHNPEGIFYQDTRFLSYFSLLIENSRPLLLSSVLSDDNRFLLVDLANPDIYRDGELILPRDLVHIRRTKFLWQAASHERLAIRNYSRIRQPIDLRLTFFADFQDIFEVRGEVRAHRGKYHSEVLGPSCVVFRYDGLDAIGRRTILQFDPAPDETRENTATYRLRLDEKECLSIFVTTSCDAAAAIPPKTFFPALRQAYRSQNQETSAIVSIESSNALFNEMLHRAKADLYILKTETPYGAFPYAGIPWFASPFGRDGIITAIHMLWVDPSIAKGVLKFLAATQSTTTDPARDAEPGKIIHEMRKGEMANLGEVPFGRYYGSVDATPLFVMLAGMYLEWTDDLETIREIWPNIEAALYWMEQLGDKDGDGFVEYWPSEKGGLQNQGWKDSNDSVFHRDGRLASGAIALCEVQAYSYAAWLYAAMIAQRLGEAVSAATWHHQAEELRRQFEAHFWSDDLHLYGLALDGSKQLCEVATSNAGHALFSGIASYERATEVASNLMRPDFFSGWGIRTVAKGVSRYNPMSYHNGSVWPHDNALIALGLSRYGFKDAVNRIFEGMYGAAEYMDLRRLPELFCGFSRKKQRGPTSYPVACSPQAWASSTPFALLKAALGLECDAQKDEVRLIRPVLPSFLKELVIRHLRVGEETIDLLLRRHNGDIGVSVLNRSANTLLAVLH